ncbi:MAG TPA: hypothetical protein VHF89_13120 [Solirubrobacteraceae bacterium]|nr:hypothetical protein [Solirubrobacteraceae bacterium]
MRILVLAREAVDAARVRSALPGDDLSDAEVLVVAPAEQESKLRFWMSDADDAIADAQERGGEVAEELREEGAHARSETGEADPVVAVRDALATFPADRILVFGDDELAQQVRSEVDVEVTAAR